jgi:hypothetical protein
VNFGNEHSGIIRSGEFLDQLGDYSFPITTPLHGIYYLKLKRDGERESGSGRTVDKQKQREDSAEK